MAEPCQALPTSQQSSIDAMWVISFLPLIIYFGKHFFATVYKL
uniref:Uncharacterized protein n=1 Tax=Nelumbo nucifera TaxID=4432 RepID=A0A822YQH9_NELNU|nr:TPA_asm: hypothetical protein HUJ06_010329 [Nelumbo nucifera]